MGDNVHTGEEKNPDRQLRSQNLCLAPVHLRRSVTRLVSYYALFKGWLLLSQPPSCFDNSTSFPT